MSEPITTLAAAVAALGALPMPVGPDQLDDQRIAEIESLLRYETSISFQSARAKESMLLLVAEVKRQRAELSVAAKTAAIVAEFVAQRADYVQAAEDTHPDGGARRQLWRGHIAAREQLAARLGMNVGVQS